MLFRINDAPEQTYINDMFVFGPWPVKSDRVSAQLVRENEVLSHIKDRPSTGITFSTQFPTIEMETQGSDQSVTSPLTDYL